jgi:signal transduction histidine kinase
MQNGRINKILIVDDVPQNIKVLGALLRQQGYAVEFALNGQEALNWMREDAFDIVLLDIMMPGMDGYEVCLHIKANPAWADVPVIFLTAKTDSDSIIKGLHAGAVDYISKPFNAEELLIRVNTHLTLVNQRRDLQELNLAHEKFFSILAHDLASPYHTLIGFTELLHRNYHTLSEDERLQYLELINEGAKNGHKLLSSLLEWARANMKKMSFNPQPVVLKNLVKTTAEFLQNSLNQKELNLQVFLQPDIEVMADTEMLKIILRNLINNAIKFTPFGGSITVNARSWLNMAEIEIADSGVGIDNSLLDHLFKIDKQVSSCGTQGETGAGLGLVLCKDFITSHKGKIWVKSTPGQGSSFFFTIPLSDKCL